MIDVALSFVETRLHEHPKGQTNVPGGEGGGEGETARQASGKIAGREGRRPEESV